MKITTLMSLVIVVCIHLEAAETNHVFTTSNNWNFVGTNVVPADKESFPTSLFPEGNWGPVVGGAQVSLRLDKTNYSVGEPIIATILVRNTTNYVLDAGIREPLHYQITNIVSHIAAEKSEMFEFGSSRGGSLVPFDQFKYVEAFDKRYNLQEGAYTVCVHFNVMLNVFDERNRRGYSVASGQAKMVITNEGK